MAYTATVIPVMIASPGDVAEERQVIREMIVTGSFKPSGLFPPALQK